MKKLLKYGLYGAAGVVALLVLAVAIISATFNPNDYKPLIIKLVQEKKQRTLNIEGDIKLAFWPKIGADLGKLSISEHNSEQTFASIQGAKVALALLPLLKKELVVDTVYIDGAQANIIKYKDGTNNFDDLLSKDEEESEQIKFDVDGVKVTNSAINYTDEGTGAKYALSKFNLTSGHIALAEPIDLATDFSATANQPALAANVKLKGTFLADPEAKHFAAKNLDASIKGDVLGGKDVAITLSGDVDAKPETREFLVDSLKLALAGQFDGAKVTLDLNAPALVAQKDEVTSKKITVSLSQEKASDNFKANLILADIKGSPKALQSSGISGDITGTQGKRSINGKFSSPFQGNLESLIFDLPKFAGNIDIKDPAIPNGSAKVSFDLSLHADAKQEQVHSKFLMNVDNTKLNGNVALANFKKPNIQFNLTADALDLNKLLGPSKPKKAEPASQKPADMSALANLLLDGKINIGQISYDKYRLSGLNVNVKADGQKLALSGLNVKFDESQIKGSLGISQFHKPLYTFDLDIDQLNLDKYIIASDKPVETKANTGDAPLDLSALKALNANGSIRIGNLRYGKTKASNVRVDLKAADGVATIAPLSANLYQGSMNGSLRVDARSTPSIAFKQDMKGIAIGPLLVDAINNDMLDGKGTLSVDVTAAGNTVGAMKKALNGTSSLQLADGAIKGIDIAGTIRNAKSKINIFKDKNSIGADQTQKTDFSELTASFNIKNGVAHNEDLAMKAPILRLAKGDSRGDVDIANETINYLAKPTIVKSLKGQGGAELDSLAGVSIPVKVTGTFSAPKYGIDFAALGTAIAKSNLIDKVGGDKAGAVKALVGDGNKVDALKGLLDKNKPADSATAPADGSTTEQPKSAEELAKEKAEQKLKKLFKF
ncbi:AsmA family protein [Methylotenera oryzisoli]|uniref:AsmA family protein n=1 Tax=Methylotenera oryzisoli TaxID=2080758 RepID=A0A4Y9VUF9_9PROT|nr:AsmA family protein [Methylotenera oryzisoli]TFW72307.1 AsmA family protein [Methylotenera oryzisoli]